MLTSMIVGRDPDSKPPTHLFQRLANTVHFFYKWTKTAEALVSLFPDILDNEKISITVISLLNIDC